MDGRRGDLEARGADQLLRDLAARRTTGRLTLSSGELTAHIWLRDGGVHTATAPEARARLGDRLVGAGLLSERQLDEALDLQRHLPQRRRLGELLVEQGHIDRETLRTYVAEQVVDSVAATLRWRTGEWTFEAGVTSDEDLALRSSVENMLMSATRRLEEWEVVLNALGSLDAVVDFVPRDDAAELALTPDEWSLLTHIDGHAGVADIADAAGYGQVEAARIIYGLVTAGVVHVVGGGSAGEAEHAGEAEDAGEAEHGAEAEDAGEAEDEDAPTTPSAPGARREELLAELAALDDIDDSGARDDERSQPGSRGGEASRRGRDDQRSSSRGFIERFRKRQ